MLSFLPTPTTLRPAEELCPTKPQYRLPFVPHQGRPVVVSEAAAEKRLLFALQEDEISVLDMMPSITGSSSSGGSGSSSPTRAPRVGGIRYPTTAGKSFLSAKACSLTLQSPTVVGAQGRQLLLTDQEGNTQMLGLDAWQPGEAEEEEGGRGKRSRNGVDAAVVVPEWQPVCGASSTVSAGGWAGWCGAEFDATDANKVVVAREYHRDLRVVDLETNTIGNQYLLSTYATSMVAFPDSPVFCVGEQNCLSIWDLRMNSFSSATKKTDQTGTSQVELLSGSSGGGNLIVSGGEDRAVVVWDRRKWTKVKIERNVLKYAIRSVASVSLEGGGSAVVVGGIDSEVRVIDVSPKLATAPAATPTAPAVATPTAEPLEGAFRQRLKQATHCSGGWRGGFASYGDGAVGLSIANEVFTTQKVSPIISE